MSHHILHIFQHDAYNLKLMDAIDASANSLARAYARMSAESFWTPELPEIAQAA